MNLKGTRVLCTGGTGSFGRAIIDRLKDVGCKIVVYSRDECKQHEMWTRHKDWPVEYIVGDVRDSRKLRHSFQGVDYIFHAAALKHVPTGEIFPEEVVATNIIGTKNVVEAAEYCGVKKVVVLSTDKAAYPISAYGGSKFLAEKIVMAHKGDTENVCLRYGNVLGSRGSVIPLFLEQISREEPITVTAFEMTRFILTLQQAVQLSLKCLRDGNNGDLFVMKPPACSIKTIVSALEFNFGRKLSQTVIGVRPGEKFHETLLIADEVYRGREEIDGEITYVRVPANTNKDFFAKGVYRNEPKDYTSLDAEQLNPEQVLAKLKEAKLL